MRALLISDDANFAASVRMLLEPHGWEVTISMDVASALKEVFPELFSCAFVHAPEIDPKSIASVRSLSAAGFSRVFIASPSVAPEWEERAYLSGATFVFELPFRPQVFVIQLHNLLAEPTPRAELPTQPQARSPETPPRPAAREVIRDFGRLLRHANDADTFIERYLSHLRELLGVSKVALYLTESTGEMQLRCAYSTGLNAEIAHNVILSLKSGIGLHARQNGVAITLNGPFGLDPMARREMASLGAQLAIPVRDREQLLGVLLLGPTVMGEPLGRDHVELLFMLMEDLGLVLRNARLHTELRRERSLFSTILEQMGVGCMVFDRDLRLVHYNRVAAGCFEVQDPKRAAFHMLPNRLSTMIYDVVQGRESKAEYIHQTSESATYLVTVEPIRESATGSASILVLAQNHTQVVADRRAAIEDAKTALIERMGGQFSHIFNNGLTSLSTVAQLFPYRRGSPEFLDEVQRTLPYGLRRLTRHVEQIHQLARRDSPLLETVALVPLLEETWQDALLFADGPKGSQLELPDDPSLVIRGTPQALKAIFFELFLNAIEASDGSDVYVTVERLAASQVRIGIHDKGGGFDEQALQRIGDEFSTNKTTGLGLGLAVVQKLLREQNESLEVGTSKTYGGGLVAVNLTSPQ